VVGVVHQRRKKVHRKHHRLLIVELVDGGVVGLGQTDEEVGVLVDLSIGEVTQDLRQGFRPGFAGSTGAGGQLGQPYRLRGHRRSFQAGDVGSRL
jgi:hypothetical protein